MRASSIRCDRRRVDDCAPLLQRLQRGPGHEKHGEDVGAEGALKLLGADLSDTLFGVLLGSIVHQNVQAAKLIDHLFHRLATELFLTYITADANAPASLFFDSLLCFLGVLIVFEVYNRDICSFFGESDRHSAADPTVSAGDQSGLAFEFAAAAVFHVFCLWLGAHLMLAVSSFGWRPCRSSPGSSGLHSCHQSSLCFDL